MKQFITFLSFALLCAVQAFSQQIFYYDVTPNVMLSYPSSPQDVQIDSPITANPASLSAPLEIGVDSVTRTDVNAPNPTCEVIMNGGYPAALDEQQVIGANNANWAQPSHAVLYDGTNGNWQHKTGSFLGVRIQISNIWYYGWIRLNISSTGDMVTIVDYACNMVPTDSIFAGQFAGTAVTNVAANNTINMIAKNKKVNFTGTGGQTFDMVLTDMGGRTLLRSTYKGETVDMSVYIPGMYIITLQNDKVKKRFKVII